MKQLCILLLLVALGITKVAADDPTFTPPDQTLTNAQHKVTIRRTYANAKQAKLILTAESINPKRDDVIRVVRRPEKEALETTPTEHPWWYDKFDGVLIPYAVTAQGLSYYVGLSKAFRNGDFSGSNNIKMKRSSLTYTADVTRHQQFEHEGESFQNVFVVTMILSWHQYCGPLCAMLFTKKRVVVFDKNRSVLRVFHDGKTGYIMS